MSEVWKKAIENKIEKEDVKILNVLVESKPLLKSDIRYISEKTKIPEKEVEKRIRRMEHNKIILKNKISVVDPMKIWDGYYVMFLKAVISPPVVGLEIKYPTGWKMETYLERIDKMQKKFGMNVVRQAYTLQGTEEDIMLVVTTNSLEELTTLFGEIAKQGWITKVRSVIPMAIGNQWRYDPISVPSPKEYEEKVEKPIKQMKNKRYGGNLET